MERLFEAFPPLRKRCRPLGSNGSGEKALPASSDAPARLKDGTAWRLLRED